MTEDELKSLMRLSTIRRWDIVEMARDQSVAEHSYRVAILAEYFYDLLYPTPHNSFERVATLAWALKHDAEEVFTGDMPSTIKETLGAKAVHDMKRWIVEKHLPSVASLMRGVMDAVPYHVVKIADTVEAIMYLEAYCMNADREAEVHEYLRKSLQDTLARAERAMPTANWENLLLFVIQRLIRYDTGMRRINGELVRVL